MEERPFDPLDYLAVLRRRKWWFVVPLVVCLLAGAALALFLPREYKSYAEIGIANPTLSPELLRGIGSLDSRERQRAISQQLLSSTVLERVVREENLSPNRRVEDTARALRGRIEEQIEVPRPIGAGPRDGIESFRLGYVDESPERAQRIANRLAAVFVEENSKTATQRAENTSEVLAQQRQQSLERMTQLQEELRKKKETYMGRLPDQAPANIQMVNGLRSQLESLSTQLRGETERLSQVESTLQMMQQGIGTMGLTSAGAAAIQASQNRLNALRQELTQARAAGFTDRHPEVVRINGEIAAAEADLQAARDQGPGNREEVLRADPLYRAKLNERDALNIRIGTLRRAEAQARAQINDYQARVEAAPMVEQELFSLTQQHELEKKRYEELATRHQNAVMAEDLARKQGGERFVILHSAFLPTAPISPDLGRILLLALAAGLVLGAVAVVGREFLDRSVHDAQALQSAFELPVLGEIPHIQRA